jgi:hypothetical protein
VTTWRWRYPRRERVVFVPPSEYWLEFLNDRPRKFSESHARLLEELRSAQGEQWSRTALLACLEHLAVSWTTEAWSVDVENAWTEGRWTFCVIYQYKYFAGRLGLRSTALDLSHPGRFKNMSGDDLPNAPDPVRFGEDVADFDIGEPLGTVADHLRTSSDGVNWWGARKDE